MAPGSTFFGFVELLIDLPDPDTIGSNNAAGIGGTNITVIGAGFTSGDSVLVHPLAAVPLPASGLLFGAALGWLGLSRRKRQKSSSHGGRTGGIAHST